MLRITKHILRDADYTVHVAEFRSDNVYMSHGIGAFVEPLFERHNQVVPVNDILVREDSGLATSEL